MRATKAATNTNAVANANIIASNMISPPCWLAVFDQFEHRDDDDAVDRGEEAQADADRADDFVYERSLAADFRWLSHRTPPFLIDRLDGAEKLRNSTCQQTEHDYGAHHIGQQMHSVAASVIVLDELADAHKDFLKDMNHQFLLPGI